MGDGRGLGPVTWLACGSGGCVCYVWLSLYQMKMVLRVKFGGVRFRHV